MSSSKVIGHRCRVRLGLRHKQRIQLLSEAQMSSLWFQVHLIRSNQLRSRWARPTATVIALLFVIPVAAMAQGSPFDTGFNAIQALFTGTIAKVASLVAIVIGGYGFAHGEPGAKKALAGVAAGTGIAVLAVNVLSWLWGV
jgi:type IV secretory pathway VirB2 component (pilin)